MPIVRSIATSEDEISQPTSFTLGETYKGPSVNPSRKRKLVPRLTQEERDRLLSSLDSSLFRMQTDD